MKNLLICTDFSESSLHAAKYGCTLAKQFNFQSVILLHTYQPLMIPVTMPLLPPYHDEERYSDAMGQLAELRHELKYMFDLPMPIEIKTEETALDEIINRICATENADMIVAGTGVDAGNEKELSENDIMDVVQVSRYPVCIVPRHTPIQPVSSVLFACDLTEFSEATPLRSLEKILELFQVPLFVVNVNDKERDLSPDIPGQIRSLHRVFDKYQAKYAFIDRENIANGIVNFAETYSVSLIITITKNYSFFQRLFHRSTTERIIRRSEFPLISIHE